MGTGLSGLASGFDWKSMVDQIIQLGRAPQKRMQADQAKNAQKTAALNQIKGLVADLKTSVASLGTKDALGKRSATVEGSAAGWTASADTGSSAGRYEFNVTQLATASKLNGATGLAKSIDPTMTLSSLPVGRTITGGDFTINGVRVTISSTDSLNDVLANINAKVPGVTATYDSVTDKVSLSGGASPVVLGASNDTSNFLLGMRLSNGDPSSSLAVSSSSLGSINLTGPIDTANLKTPPTSSTGSFEVNGTAISYDTSQDSLQTLISRINDSAAGVTAALDPGSGRFVLTSDTTGNTGTFVAADTGGLAASLGLTSGTTLVNGADAQFQINGGNPITSRTNTLDASSHGITGLTVTATSKGANVVTVAADNSQAKTGIDSFIAKYNALQNAIEQYTKVTTTGGKVTAAILAGNLELSDISKSLRRMIYDDASGGVGKIKRLADMGVGFSGIENTLSITDSSLLSTKLADSADDISNYFNRTSSTTPPTGGLIERMDAFLSKLVDSSGAPAGSFKTKLDSITSQNKSLDAQIAEIDRQLEAQRSSLEASFTAMESAQSKYQQQSAYLTKTFSGNSN